MSREKARYETRFFDFEIDPPVGFLEAKAVIRQALDDEGLVLMDGTNVETRVTVVRMHLKGYGRVMDRFVVPGGLITEKVGMVL